MKRILSILITFFCFQGIGQNQPAPKQIKSILILNAKAHLGNGKMLKRSAIGIRDGKIDLVLNAIIHDPDKSKYDTIIDAAGSHVYPAFIAMNSTLGLREIDQLRASGDESEIGRFTPHVRALPAFNIESEIIPTVRRNGVLLGQISPRGGVISGSSSVVAFDGWGWEDAVLREDEGIHLYWPRLFSVSGWWAEPGVGKKNGSYSSNVEDLKHYFKRAVAYANGGNELTDLQFEAMRGLFDGTKSLYIHANYVKEIMDLASFTNAFKIKNVVLVGGYDSWKVTDLLKENKIAVMYRRVHSLPIRPEDDVDLPYRIPSILQKEGVLFCLNNAGSMERMQTRNLPFNAGTAVAYGLEYEQAVAAISLNPAKILGLDNRLGSIEVGKDASLFISKGDALDMKTNNLTLALIQGRIIQLDGKQERLYHLYKKKYRLK